MRKHSAPTLFQSIITIVVLIVFLVLNIWLLDDDPLNGGSQMALLMASLVAGVIAWFNGVRWPEMQKGIVDTISQAVTAIIVLLFIGMLAASWILGGIIPALIHYGLYILHPAYFLPTVVVISALISVGTGSSWSTIATVGVAFMGIGNSLGFSDALTAGAIISGAYFGDKVSPLSDTTNLASAVSGVDLFKHIRYMMNTTVPTIVLTIIIFTVISLFGHRSADISVDQIHSAIQGTFNVTPWVFLVLLLVGLMIYKKLPAVVTLCFGSLLGLLSALLFQPDLLRALSGSGSASDIFTLLLGTLYKGNEIATECAEVDALISSSGMSGMLNTIWLIISAMIFGGIMIAGGFLQKITMALIAKVSSTGGLVSTTAVSCVLFNILTADQYITIVLSGKMYSEAFKKEHLAPEVLSRTIEDSGTVTSVLVPWNSCGATQSAVLGVPTLAYLPYCFFCYLSPLMTVLFAWLNIRIHRLDATVEEDRIDR